MRTGADSTEVLLQKCAGYHIIVAGSLLGIAVSYEQFSFPVGKVDIKTLYPMDMEEFLFTCGETDLVRQIKY